MAVLNIPVQIKTATAAGQVPTSLLAGELGLDPFLGKLWWADNTGAKQSIALPGLATSAALQSGLAGVAQVDDVRQLMIQVAKLQGRIAGYVSGFADDYQDQSGVDMVSSSGFTYDPTNKLFSNLDATTKLLMHFDASATADDASHTITASNCSLSTSVSKFGGSSLALNGSSSYLTIAANNGDLAITSTNTWTIELWVYLTALPSSAGALVTQSGINFYVYSDGSVRFDNGSTYNIISSNKLTLNAWHKIEANSNNGAITLYVDGVSVASGTMQATSAQTTLYAGGNPNSGYYLSGYMDEIRISIGVQRHTANYTPETAAFTLSPPAGDLRSVAAPASIVPSKAGIFLLAKALNGGTITPNTNLIASVSRTGSASPPTWTQVTLVAAGSVGGFTAYEANAVDISAQASGSSMRTRLQTANGLAIQPQANVMQWAA